MNDQILFLGILLIIIGTLLVFLSSIGNQSNVKYSVIGFVGPIPFGISNSRDLLIISILISIIILVFLLFFLH